MSNQPQLVIYLYFGAFVYLLSVGDAKCPNIMVSAAHLVYRVYLAWTALNIRLSYDVAVIQWITSCQKSYAHMCNNSFARTRNVIDNVHANIAFSYQNNVHF